MGGGLLLIVIFFTTLLWGELNNHFVWVALVVTLFFGVVGWYDDYLKLSRKNSRGLIARWKYLWQSVIASAYSDTNSFRLIADEYGAMLSDLTLLKPLTLPDKWRDLFVKMLTTAQREIDKAIAREEAKGEDKDVVIAERHRSDEELLRIANQLGGGE